MPAIPSTQIPVTYKDTRYSGVYSVSGTLMIARIPGVGSKSVELEDTSDPTASALAMLEEILNGAAAEGRL